MPNPDTPKENILSQDSVDRWICVFQDIINPGLKEAQETGKMPKCPPIHINNLLDKIDPVLGDDVSSKSVDLLKAEINTAVKLLKSLNFDQKAIAKLDGLLDKSDEQKSAESIEEARKRIKSEVA